jgi:hypothetical protein
VHKYGRNRNNDWYLLTGEVRKHLKSLLSIVNDNWKNKIGSDGVPSLPFRVVGSLPGNN